MLNDLVKSYIHKSVPRRRPKSDLRFLTSQSLFSSHSIDPGTNLLLRALTSSVDRGFRRCLDVGCGYGVIGMVLVAEGLVGELDLIDRDALALAFTRLNVAENGIPNTTVTGSLGLDDAPRDEYDLIVANLPGKASVPVLLQILDSALEHLTGGGQFWGVVVSPLWPSIKRHLSRPEVETLHVESGARHVTFGVEVVSGHAAKSIQSGFPKAYERDSVDFIVQGRTHAVQTSHGLPEFDGLSYSTKLLLEQLYNYRERRCEGVAVFNVTQGYIPLAIRLSGMSDSLHVSDRDLLALKATQRNLQLAGVESSKYQLHHSINWLPGDGDAPELVVGTLRGDEPRGALESGAESVQNQLAPGGIALVAGGSTAITRLQSKIAAAKGFRLIAREKYRGSSVICFSKN